MPATLHLTYLAALVVIITGFALRLRRLKVAGDIRLRTLEQHRDRLQAANNARADFLVNISQEIRTPMNTIVGFTDLALKSELEKELREDLNSVRTSAEWLLHIVDDIIEFSRMEAGQLQLENSPFSIAECVRSVLNTIQPEIDARGLSLHCRFGPDLPSRVSGDGARLRHVLFNLLDNAVKFTSSGGINVLVAVEPSRGNSLHLRITLADTGIGIPPEEQPFIFEPFRPGAAGGGDRCSRYGFGLAIAQRLTNLMGGDLEFQSTLGAGSTFLFTAPFERFTGPVNPSHALTGLAPRVSVLVAEDNAVNRRLITKLLESAGHAVTTVANGEEAVRLFAAGCFEVILMDLDMPEMDGLEATRQIRLLEDAGRQTRIYALTAHTQPEDRDRCFRAGMDGFISKPIHIDDVLQIVSALKVPACPETSCLSA